MPDKPAIERTVSGLRAIAIDTEATRRALERAKEGQADEFLTELEDRLSDAYDGVNALLSTARAAVEWHGGKRFSDWVAKAEEALDSLGNINANGAPTED